MCGINGYMQSGFRLKIQELEAIINQMNEAIIHRGPDESGKYTNERISLGMNRLSIIDLTTGSQPIFNTAKTKVIIFNGEIYNYKILRQKLITDGYKFSTNSDTEVVLAAYEKYGNECLTYLNGMFAFAIFDILEENLFIARDRAGEKPLYYTKSEEAFMFASELKSLVKPGLINKKINHTALCQYLQLTYIPAPLTIFENVYKLPAAHFMNIDKNGKVSIEKYWDITYNNKHLINDYNTCKTKLHDTVFEAVEDAMISDVPLGAFLSGGIDSTTVVGIMSKISSKPINTFTIGFKNKEFDESKRALAVAEKYKTNHTNFILDYDTALLEIDTILNNIDEPFADSSAIPTYFVSQFASKYVKVILTGDGGDELFGGYSKYLISYYSEKYNALPTFLRNSIFEPLIYSLPDKSVLTRKLRKVIETANNPIFEQRRALMCLGFNEIELKNLLLPDFIVNNSLDFIYNYYMHHDTDELSRTLYTDFHVVLEGDMLAKVDRMGMLKSIETRVPLLNKNVIELAAQIPSKYKIQNKSLKKIFKDTFKDLIPAEIFNATKRGFAVPIDHWFRGPLESRLNKAFTKERIENQGIFNYNYILSLIEEHKKGYQNRSSELWSLFVFQEWYGRYFLND